MFELEGPIRLERATSGEPLVVNGSQLALGDVGVLYKRPVGETEKFEVAWVGRLPVRQSRTLSFVSAPQVGSPESDQAEQTLTSPFAGFDVPSHRDGARLDLANFHQLAHDWNSLEPGEMRLVGRVDELLGGEEIAPAASQVRAATLVVVRLVHGHRPEPEPDVNTKKTPQPEAEPAAVDFDPND
jgi:hypothetical protein